MDRTALHTPYVHTQYRVRLVRGGSATIRIDEPLPAALAQALPAPGAPWAFVTAWNPHSQPQAVAINRARQRTLLAALRPWAAVLRAGVGIAGDGQWREPSVWVAGVAFAQIDRLLQPFAQHAIVRGIGAQPAQLHWLD